MGNVSAYPITPCRRPKRETYPLTQPATLRSNQQSWNKSGIWFERLPTPKQPCLWNALPSCETNRV